jgi:predicted O-methyltransferase YrrM
LGLIDSFLFAGERLMLKARFEYLNPVVDAFVICEASRDHANHRRETDFGKFLAGETQWIDSIPGLRQKLYYVHVDDLPFGDNNWPRVWWQRNAISRAIEGRPGISLDDFLLISDIDEFPPVEILQSLKDSHWSVPGSTLADTGKQMASLLTSGHQQPAVIQFLVKMYYYDIFTTTDAPWVGSRLTTVRDALHVSPEVIRRWPSPVGQIHAGWHLSYFGGIDAIIKKMESIAESSWTASAEFTDRSKLEAHIRAAQDLYDRPNESWYHKEPEGIPDVLLKYFPAPVFGKQTTVPEVNIKPTIRSLQALPGYDWLKDHLGTLSALASGCDSVVELGLYHGVSTRAFLVGLAEVDPERKPFLQSVDIALDHTTVCEVTQIADTYGVDWSVDEADSRVFPPQACDLLFVDSDHHYDLVTCELERHGPHARKYIVLHDTAPRALNGWGDIGTQPGTKGVKIAMDDWLAQHPEWRIKSHTDECCGLTVLERVAGAVSDSKPEGHESLLDARMKRLPTINGYTDMAPFGEVLHNLARKSRHVLEFGTFNGISTTFLLAGLDDRDLDDEPGIVCVDLQETPDIEELRQITRQRGIGFTFAKGTSLDPRWWLPAEGTTYDLVLIDTWHNAAQVQAELDLVKNHCQRIALHDTELFGFIGNDKTVGVWAAIGEFLAKNREWRVEAHYPESVGMTVLVKGDQSTPTCWETSIDGSPPSYVTEGGKYGG